MYAENLLRVIRQQHIRGAASLIAQLGRIFQEKEQQDRVQHQQPDREQRRQIDEKKQALGIRDRYEICCPPRGEPDHAVTPAPCHDDTRKRTFHLKILQQIGKV